MDFKVLCVGDVVGTPGLERIRRSLRYLKRKTGADFVIVNGENASAVGMTPDQGEDILDSGADVITMATTPSISGKSSPIWTNAPRSSAPPTMPPRTPAGAGLSSIPRQAPWLSSI